MVFFKWLSIIINKFKHARWWVSKSADSYLRIPPCYHSKRLHFQLECSAAGQHFHSTHPLANTLQVHSASTDVDADECAPRLTQWRVESAIKKDMKTSPGLGGSRRWGCQGGVRCWQHFKWNENEMLSLWPTSKCLTWVDTPWPLLFA